MKKNEWTIQDQLAFESDVVESTLLEEYADHSLDEVWESYDEFCSAIYQEF